MRIKFALQTLIVLPLWLCLQNFNATACSSCGHADFSRLLDKGAGKSNYKIKKVVLDAGHGGKDPGCLGAQSKEKDNALAIVLKLGALIEEQFPDVEVIYTRKTDVFVELNERAAIANRNNADLFISVHCNSISVSSVKGTETYVLGLHRADHNLEVAKRENASIYLEENYQQNYGGYDPNSPEAHIFSSVWQSAYLEQSILFASFVQDYAASLAGRDDKGVKQAGFLVLRETAMPAVLIEAGYMTNRHEENFLISEEGRLNMALSIFKAFESYKSQMEGAPIAAAQPPKPTPKTVSITQSALYRIHLMSWPTRIDTASGQFALLSNVKEEKIGSEYQYFLGTFASPQEADRVLAEIRNLGFQSASIQTVR